MNKTNSEILPEDSLDKISYPRSGLNITDKSGYEIILNNSIFKGIDEKLKTYTLKAAQAFKTGETSYKLNDVNMLYELSKNSNLIVTANTGLLNEETKLLRLQDKVKFFFHNIIFNSNEAQINLLNNDILSNSPVSMVYKNSLITSDYFFSKEDNNSIIFKGNVATTIDIGDF